MVEDKLFWNRYLVNYFDYKIGTLSKALDNPKSLSLENTILDYNETELITSIKSDIRQTVFQAIETVFEIIFALSPSIGKKSPTSILETITISELPYPKIREISESVEALNFFDETVILSNKSKSSTGEFIFYLGMQKSKHKEKFPASIEAIKYGLHMLAKEFSDRKEYNSYKHGLRIIPAFKNLAIFDPKKEEVGLSWDLDDTMTYFTFNKSKKETQYRTRTFDTDRDKRMVSFCSYLLWNMIKIRDYVANRIERKDNFAVFLFSKESIEKVFKTNVKIQDFAWTLKYNN